MFKKKPNIKTLAPLRSSDRRRVTDQIISDYHVAVPVQENGEEHGEESGTPSSSLGALRNALLPEGALSAKFSTTIGPDLKTVQGTVYVASFPGEELRILWIKLEDKIIPTVYILWRHAGLVPLLHTPGTVLQKMQGGADLMTPGLARGPPFPSSATKGAIVAVASLEKPSVPAVVGICEIDISSLTRIQGAKGHAVRSIHWDGDEIWAWSQGGNSGGEAPSQLEGWDTVVEEENLEEVGAGLELIDLGKEDDRNRVDLKDSDEDSIQKKDHNNYIDGEDGELFQEVSMPRKEFSTKEIDGMFRNAFLYAIHHHRNAHRHEPNHGLGFPVPQSLFISNLILPYLPIFTPEDVNSIQIKKTSWKNAKKFIKALDKEKLLKSKDRNGGETVVQDVDFEDPAFTAFVPYSLPKKETTSAEAGGGGGGKSIINQSSDTSIGQKLKKLHLLRPKEKLSPLFEMAGSSIKALYLPVELRPIITAYTEAENLISEMNKRLVNLNPILVNAVFDGQSSIDNDVIAKGSVPREALIDRIVQSCTPYWAILRNEETRDSAKPKAGTAPMIKILLEIRSGNKTVTKISGVEAFHINPQLLADELQKACASATSVNQLSGSSPKNPVQEILVQGPQKDVVLKALERRGVRKEWVEILDKTKGKKR